MKFVVNLYLVVDRYEYCDDNDKYRRQGCRDFEFSALMVSRRIKQPQNLETALETLN